MGFDVWGSFSLFLACNVNVAASCVFVYAAVFLFFSSKMVRRGPGRQHTFLTSLGRSEENRGRNCFFHSSQRWITREQPKEHAFCPSIKGRQIRQSIDPCQHQKYISLKWHILNFLPYSHDSISALDSHHK